MLSDFKKGMKMNEVFSYPKNRLIKMNEASIYLGLKKSYIYNLINKGKIKSYKVGNKAKGSLRFQIQDLDDFLGIGNDLRKKR